MLAVRYVIIVFVLQRQWCVLNWQSNTNSEKLEVYTGN